MANPRITKQKHLLAQIGADKRLVFYGHNRAGDFIAYGSFTVSNRV